LNIDLTGDLTGEIDEHKFLVELACSTALAPAYSPPLFEKIMDSITSEVDIGGTSGSQRKSVVFIVCGGAKATLGDMRDWDDIIKHYLDDNGQAWGVNCNGEELRIAM